MTTEERARKGAIAMSAKHWTWFEWYRCDVNPDHWHVGKPPKGEIKPFSALS